MADGRRAARWWPALAAAAAVVAVAGTVLAVVRASSPGGDAPAAGGRGPRDVTDRTVARLLAAMPVLPGARPAGRAPVAALDQPLSEPASDHLVSRTAWWTAPGTVAAALRYLERHPPAGVTVAGSANSGGTGPAVDGLLFDAAGRGWSRPSTYTQLGAVVSLTSAAGGVAVRVDVQAIWLPRRAAPGRLPADVTSVDVVLRGPTGATLQQRTLGAPAARSLAALINRLPVMAPGRYSCPLDDGRSDLLTFAAPGRTVPVRVGVTGCGQVEVGTSRSDSPALTGGREVHAAVLAALRTH